MHLIFVSSPQEEFARARRDLCYFILTDPYLKQYFDVFLFENLPSNKRNPKMNYREKVKDCALFLGLLGRTYGTPGDDGKSATEHEFDYAAELEKDKILFLKKLPRGTRIDSRMAALIAKAGPLVSYKEFKTIDELKIKVMQSLLCWQQEQAAAASRK